MFTDARARHGRRRTLALIAAAIVAVALLVSGIALALPDHNGISRSAAGPQNRTEFASARVTTPGGRTGAHPTGLAHAVLTISPNASTVSVPPSYFGLSTEYWTLPLFADNMPVFERVLSMLHVPGDGPLVLRIGGDSADHSFWAPKARRMP